MSLRFMIEFYSLGHLIHKNIEIHGHHHPIGSNQSEYRHETVQNHSTKSVDSNDIVTGVC